MPSTKNLLLDLPPELVETVAICLDDDDSDLLSLRLVSKEVASRTERPMLDRNYSHIRILFPVRRSLRNAYNITAHPKLGSATRSIDICQGIFSREPIKEMTFPANSNVPIGKKAHREVRRRYFNLVEDQEEMRKTHENAGCLQAVFRNLSANTQKIRVRLVSLSSADLDRIFSYRVGWTPDNYNGVLAPQWNKHATLRQTLCALQELPHLVEGFKAGGPKYAIPLAEFNTRKPMGGFWYNLKALNELRLFIELEPRTENLDKQHRQTQNFIDFLQSLASQLKRFGIIYWREPTSDLDDDDDPPDMRQANDTFDRVCASIVFPRLEHLAAQAVDAKYDRLVRFVRGQASTLQSLDLQDVTITDHELDVTDDKLIRQLKSDLEGVGFPAGEGSLKVSLAD